MRILITNDDGINAPSLRLLVNWAKKHGEVTVVAPKLEQSGKSHGIELHHPFEVKRIDCFPEVDAFFVDSTPADCVRVAMLILKREFDLVISGINNGYNVGVDIVYSGTVSAAFEASYFNINAVAVSSDFKSTGITEAQLEFIYDRFIEERLFEKCKIYNVNIPDNAKKISYTAQGGRYYSDDFIKLDNNMYSPNGFMVFENKHDITIDTDAVAAGYISITPLLSDRTDHSALNTVSK